MLVTPFGDTQAHGAFGKSVILERRRGIVYAKSFRIPKNPRSIEQKIQRQKFTAAITGWQSLTPLEQDYFNQLASGKTYTGFNLYVSKQLLETPPSTTPLLINETVNAHITTTRSSYSLGWDFLFFNPSPYVPFGSIEDNSNIYTDRSTSPTPVFLLINIEESEQPIDIHANDTILLTFNTDIKLYIFFPTVNENIQLYPADDGSTYYDAGMTNLAQAAP